MAQSDNTKSNILAYVHMHVVRRVLRRLLEYCVYQEDNTWTVDRFLFQNMHRILETRIGRETRQVLFPGYREDTNVASWPLILFPFLITEISGTSLSSEIVDIIRQLTDLRHTLHGRIFSGISDQFFHEHLNDIEARLTNICVLLNDDELTRQTLSDLRTEEVREDYIDDFKNNYKQAKSYREQMTSLRPEQLRLHQQLEKVVNLREERERERGASGKCLPPQPYDQCTVDLRSLVIELHLIPEFPEQSRQIANDIANIINNKDTELKNKELIQNKEAIRAASDRAFSGFGEYYAQLGCIEIHVRLNSIQSLIQLISKCVSGSITDTLKPILDIVRTIPGCETYELHAVLYKDAYNHVMDGIASQVLRELENRCLEEEPKKKVKKVSATDRGSLLLRVGYPSVEEKEAIELAVKNGELYAIFNELENELKTICSDKKLRLQTSVFEDSIPQTDTEHAPEPSADDVRKVVVSQKPSTSPKKRELQVVKSLDIRAGNDSEDPNITGCSIVSLKRLAVADRANRCIKLVDTEAGKCSGQSLTLPYAPWDVINIDENTAIASAPSAGKLLRLKIGADKIELTHEYEYHDSCRGLAYSSGRLYVTYGRPYAKINLFNIFDASVQQTIHHGMMHDPWYITVDNANKSMYVSETENPTILHLSSEGRALKCIDFSGIGEEPLGVILKDSSKLWVCCYSCDKTQSLLEIDVESGESEILFKDEGKYPSVIQIHRRSGNIFLNSKGSSCMIQCTMNAI
ncbi:hypothetical protein DPMN_126187 [Dreissena polymorpha]|uniref:Uncharacterized protein n=2 Tax=Dreissena polymorpha TaxID=45954 RepID=A0A9D4GWU8_DREPO|nr:hypothetical protein DPMN_126187 [Dreissena polymorpha]